MTEPNDSAMPSITTEIIDLGIVEQEQKTFHSGLSKREYFAVLAMQGMLSNHTIIDSIHWEWIATESVKQSDALIKELNK